MARCPFCGGPLVGTGLKWIPAAKTLVWDGGAARLSPQEAVMFDMLWGARASGDRVLGSEIIKRLYGGKRQGGALTASKSPAFLAAKIRKKIRGSGLTIRGEVGRIGGYWLISV